MAMTCSRCNGRMYLGCDDCRASGVCFGCDGCRCDCYDDSIHFVTYHQPNALHRSTVAFYLGDRETAVDKADYLIGLGYEDVEITEVEGEPLATAERAIAERRNFLREMDRMSH